MSIGKRRAIKIARQSIKKRPQRQKPKFVLHDWVASLSAGVTAFIAIVGTYYIVLEQQDREDARVVRAWALLREGVKAKTAAGQREAVKELMNAGVSLQGADLSYGNYYDVHWKSGGLESVKLLRANLRMANLKYASLFQADLSEAFLLGTNLTWANLASANLTGANLSVARLKNANLTGANLTGAKNLTQRQLNDAIFNPEFPPKLPEQDPPLVLPEGGNWK